MNRGVPVRTSRWEGSDQEVGGPEQQREVFPTFTTVPGPQNVTGSMAGVSNEQDSRGEGEAKGGAQLGRAGLMYQSGISHGCNTHPNGGGAAHDGGLASMRSEGGTQSNGPGGPAGSEGEYY